MSISFQLGFFPYIRIPVRYILPANQVVSIKPPISIAIERPNCHQGTVLGIPKGIRHIMMIGELKGIILAQKARSPVGSAITGAIRAMEKITSIVIGNESDWASRMSSFTALPMAANSDE